MPTPEALQSPPLSQKKCSPCLFSNKCIHVVEGQGKTPADIMFVGEFPATQSSHLDDTAKRFLEKMMQSAGLTVEHTFMTSMLHCMMDRDDSRRKGAMASCKVWLWEEMKRVSPLVLISLGSAPTNLLMRQRVSLKSVLGDAYSIDYVRKNGILVPMYHPDHLMKLTAKDVGGAVNTLVKVRRYCECSITT